MQTTVNDTSFRSENGKLGGASPEPVAQYDEGPVARSIEKQTAKLPSDIFLWAAGASIIGSLVLQAMKPERTAFFTGRRRTSELATFVGQWAPTILLLGLYNKIVKVAGSDRRS